MCKKYIGVDLGAWYNKKNKTSIVILKEKANRLEIEKIISKETNLKTLKKETNKEILNYEEKNRLLVEYLLEQNNSKQIIIAIDAPFAIPARLKGIEEKPYKLDKKYQHLQQLKNPYLFDNSARFVMNTTKQTVLAPCATLVGALTSRMKHIIDNYKEKLNIVHEPVIIEKYKKLTVEVFPTATLYQLIKNKTHNNQYTYLKAYNKDQKEANSFTKLISYKNTNWNKNTKERMMALCKPFIKNLAEKYDEIQSDDDYDALICALTAYFIGKEDGYLKPDQPKLFTNSFIYIPKIK